MSLWVEGKNVDVYNPAFYVPVPSALHSDDSGVGTGNERKDSEEEVTDFVHSQEYIPYHEGPKTYPQGRAWEGDFNNGQGALDVDLNLVLCQTEDSLDFGNSLSVNDAVLLDESVPDWYIVGEPDDEHPELQEESPQAAEKEEETEGEWEEEQSEQTFEMPALDIADTSDSFDSTEAEVLAPEQPSFSPNEDVICQNRDVNEGHAETEGVYTGQWNDGKWHGQGKVLYPDGSAWEGRWEAGKLIQGKIMFPDGVTMEGKWSDDQLTSGKMRFPDGTFLQGEFREGLLWNGVQ
eukprot:gene35690-40375_t